jgi:hypothetical protein
MNRFRHHVRSNVIAYLALFVALGGTSYAAVSLPPGSVGSRQIRNRAVTSVKLDPRSIAASVRAWVILGWNSSGTRLVARAASSRVRVATGAASESVTWPGRHFARNCLISATPQVNSAGNRPLGGSVTAHFDPSASGGAFLALFGFAPNGSPIAQAAYVVVVCP